MTEDRSLDFMSIPEGGPGTDYNSDEEIISLVQQVTPGAQILRDVIKQKNLIQQQLSHPTTIDNYSCDGCKIVKNESGNVKNRSKTCRRCHHYTECHLFKHFKKSCVYPNDECQLFGNCPSNYARCHSKIDGRTLKSTLRSTLKRKRIISSDDGDSDSDNDNDNDSSSNNEEGKKKRKITKTSDKEIYNLCSEELKVLQKSALIKRKKIDLRLSIINFAIEINEDDK